MYFILYLQREIIEKKYLIKNKLRKIPKYDKKPSEIRHQSLGFSKIPSIF